MVPQECATARQLVTLRMLALDAHRRDPNSCLQLPTLYRNRPRPWYFKAWVLDRIPRRCPRMKIPDGRRLRRDPGPDDSLLTQVAIGRLTLPEFQGQDPASKRGSAPLGAAGSYARSPSCRDERDWAPRARHPSWLQPYATVRTNVAAGRTYDAPTSCRTAVGYHRGLSASSDRC